MGLRFEWDKAKAARSLQKHGVSFDEASTVFHDALARIFDDDDHSLQEAREIIIDSANGKLLVVSFTERAMNKVRIISARPATNQERDDYEKNQYL